MIKYLLSVFYKIFKYFKLICRNIMDMKNTILYNMFYQQLDV
jgi:hypothetical protein